MNITIHNKLAEEVKAIFQDMKNAGFKIKPGSTGGYVWRANTTSGKSLSRHALGAALDINWDDNSALPSGQGVPLGTDYSTVSGSTYKPGTNEYSIPEEIVKIWEDHGFFWGRYFSNRFDPMHFDFVDQGGLDPNK